MPTGYRWAMPVHRSPEPPTRPDRHRSFVPGITLAERLYVDHVRPILARHHGHLRYSAALIGSGSEVLGFDDEMSTDHHWGPRVMLFLPDGDLELLGEPIRALLARELPTECCGYPTSFTPPDPLDKGVQHLEARDAGPVLHRVELLPLAGFFHAYAGISLSNPLGPLDWLTIPQQKLRSLTAGAVFHDDLDLRAIRERLSFYPRDIWLYLLAATWKRIGEEEHLMGRSGSVGDELGSALIAARLVRDVVRLAFLMERTYAPYPKWLGTAFGRLSPGKELGPLLLRGLSATAWQDREKALSAAFEQLARRHNSLGLTDPVPAEVAPFWGRPFRVIGGERIAVSLVARIEDPQVQAIAKRSLAGSIDLISDSTDVLEDSALLLGLRGAASSAIRMGGL